MTLQTRGIIERAKTVLGTHLDEATEYITAKPWDIECSAVQMSTQRRIIRRYVAAIAVNFTDWMGKTLPWVHSDEAEIALRDNLRCEQAEDHISMLLGFAQQVDGLPGKDDYDFVAKDVARIRFRMSDTNCAGLCGLVLMTLLENLSEVFIPLLERMAVNLHATDLTYTQAHGEADAEHSQAFREALKHELATPNEYDEAEFLVADTTELTLNLLKRIFSVK